MDDNLKILIVDNIQIMRKILMKSLFNINYTNIVEAANEEEAVKILESDSEISFVIVDWCANDLVNRKLIKNIRKSAMKFKDVPILVVVNPGQIARSVENEEFSTGSIDYIAKPFTSNVLFEKIDRLIFKTKFKKPDY